MNITVIGSGSWGTALAYVLASNGHQVLLWSFKEAEACAINLHKENREFLPGILLQDNIRATADKKEAAEFAESIVFAVPSKFVRVTLDAFADYIKEDTVVINVSKGLEEGSLKRLSQVIHEVLPKVRVAALSGPSHAEEVGMGLPTTVVASSLDRTVAKYVQDLFMNENFRVYTNGDLIGVELGGALKNVIALAAGMADGLGFGDNTKAALMTRGIREISKLGQAMGAEINTFSGLTGIGDLIVTCTSMHSRNRRAGILLGQGKSLEETLKEVHMVVEGVYTSRAAYELSLKYDVSMPITTEIFNVLEQGKDPKEAVADLMTRDKTQEHQFENELRGKDQWI